MWQQAPSRIRRKERVSRITEPPTLSVIIPAYRCADMLQRCLVGLLASDLPRSAWQLIVVDDGSGDDTAAVATRLADRVITIPGGPHGPAFARNRGADSAGGDVLVFIDADVVVAPDALRRFAALFRESPVLGAAFGAYDTTPGDPGFFSQYRNLLHHWVHVSQPGDAWTFWTGCGAVRRAVFLALGGFDAARYRSPQIEDIEFGYRVVDAGHRIVLDPEIQGTHLKRWTLVGMLRSDLFDRAIPWMQLLLRRGDAFGAGPLNVRRREKLFTVLTALALLTGLAALVTRGTGWLVASAVCLVGICLGNARLLAWFARTRGPVFALCTIPCRLVFYFESGLGAAWAMLTYRRHARTAMSRTADGLPHARSADNES